MAVDHLGAGDELLAGHRMREVALVQALDGAVAVDEDLAELGDAADDARVAVVVVVVVGEGPEGHWGDLFEKDGLLPDDEARRRRDPGDGSW